MNNKILSKYGYSVGEVVVNCVSLETEQGEFLDVGTLLKIVAISPKVRIAGGKNKDTKKYFFNAVKASQENDYSNRIRENFCCIQKYDKES